MVDCRNCKKFKGIIPNTHYFLCKRFATVEDEDVVDTDCIEFGSCDAYVSMDSNNTKNGSNEA